MALIDDSTTCPLCGELLGDRPFVATPAFITSSSDPLYEFSDAAMHYDCFQTWEHREAFVDEFNSYARTMRFGQRPERMRPDGTIESVPL